MPMLTAMGSRLSHLLHHFIFSLPSPNNTTSLDFKSGRASGDDARLEELFDEPGEGRALAGGIGPLSFVGSGYGVLLVLMAILLNRIHHIVRRPRPPPPPPPLPHPPRRGLHRLRHAISRTLTHPSTPMYIRLPGIFALTRAWIIFTVVLLQVANLWPQLNDNRSFGRPLIRIGNWVGNMEMTKVCWQVFISVCTGLACGGLANGLDRSRRRDVGASFNLFGYSFLLHLYSSPLTHHHPTGSSSRPRPDVHALFQLWLGLTELAWLQAAELSSSLRDNLLLPTGVCGTLGLMHFVYALLTAPLKFPSFTFLTHLMALLLSVVITFTVALKAITYLFTYGYIPSLVSLLPHEGVVPNQHDDFGVTLLKIGTACIEATQYSGLRNELVTVEEHRGPWIEMSATGSDVHKTFVTGVKGFDMEITNIEVSQLADPHAESMYWKEQKAFWRACAKSAKAFVWGMIMATPVGRKSIKLIKKAWLKRWWYGPRQWRVWRREAWREPPLAIARRRIARRVDEVQAMRRAQAYRTPSPEPSYGVSTAVDSQAEAVSYNRFLLGQVDLEDDDEDWEDDASSTSSNQSADSEIEEQALYQDLVANQDKDGDDIQPVLLAHLTSRNATPLTRRRYAALLTNSPSTPQPSLGMQEIVKERRIFSAGQPVDEDDEERRRACVVCMTQMRDTILWPCRCLALCNDCRESLASRLSAQDHMCPCCRRKVDGYSRIYVP
ncbi:hypothetical protein I203_104759 [Kwoniella mangroviensis CBS 8507]|uniref:uncharacterized protein n=1 Tax=Kwoniella mangroviensis CBS 8507 TaxID=1296122 RepID=UPI00080D242E|nr:uncharacterized protein I203_00297 [Kwoniella mangroviensis CBS 8507]OCF70165.1 hypothetical protein I203_00297 [Kwoniella mangroviensis CBS 8507]